MQIVKFDQSVAKYLKDLKDIRPDDVKEILARIKRGLYPSLNTNKICTNPVLYETFLDSLMLQDESSVGYRIVWVLGDQGDVVCVTMIHEVTLTPPFDN